MPDGLPHEVSLVLAVTQETLELQSGPVLFPGNPDLALTMLDSVVFFVLLL